MSVPKKKRTKSSAGNRRSHHGLKAVNLTTCSKCGKAVKPHTVCSFCGNYKNKQEIETKTATKKQ